MSEDNQSVASSDVLEHLAKLNGTCITAISFMTCLPEEALEDLGGVKEA